MLHHAQIVRDEQIGQPQLGLQVPQQIDDLCLHRNIQRGHRLVAHYEARMQHQRAGDADALALTAGELVRIAIARPLGQPHQGQHVGHRLARPGVHPRAMDQQRFGDDVLHRHARVQRAERVLEDDLHGAPLVAQRLALQVADVLAVEQDGAAARLDQPDQQPPERRLATAGFADQAERLAGLDAQRHVVHRAQRQRGAAKHRAGLDRKMFRDRDRLDQHRHDAANSAARMQAAVCAVS